MKYNGPEWLLKIFKISFTVVWICTGLLVTHVVSFEFYGFGVDSSGRLYIGWGNKIEVYEDGTKIHTIRNKTSRGNFYFTIQEDDTILLSTKSSVFIMDLKGEKVFDSWPDENEETYELLKANSSEFLAANGDWYIADEKLSGVTIYHEGKIIHKTPFIDFIVTCVVFIGFPCCLIGGIICEKKYGKMF